MFKVHYQNGETSAFETEEEAMSAVNYYGGTVYDLEGNHIWSSFRDDMWEY